jgi:hypothetical protein
VCSMEAVIPTSADLNVGVTDFEGPSCLASPKVSTRSKGRENQGRQQMGRLVRVGDRRIGMYGRQGGLFPTLWVLPPGARLCPLGSASGLSTQAAVPPTSSPLGELSAPVFSV